MSRLHFVEEGSGVPVLALHGWTPDHRLMLGCLEPVFDQRPGYRRLYPDLPGMGKSPAPESIASSADILDALGEFVDETIGGEPFLLAGESYGGYLARALAHSRPGQVRGLALICPLVDAVPHAERVLPRHEVLEAEPGLLDAVDPRVAAEFADLAVLQTAETLRRFGEEILAGLDLADRAAMARIAQNWQLPAPPETGVPFGRPTLIIAGRQDASVGYAEQFALLPHYPRASFVVLDRAGHNLQFEQPELFETLLLDWLDRSANPR